MACPESFVLLECLIYVLPFVRATIFFRGIEFGELLSAEVRAKHPHTTYDLVANIVHDGEPGPGKGTYRVHILHQVHIRVSICDQSWTFLLMGRSVASCWAALSLRAQSVTRTKSQLWARNLLFRVEARCNADGLVEFHQ
jgi:hypothetical protein